jgi:hypothetical protein
MLPPKKKPTSSVSHISVVFEQLSTDRQQSLYDFAQFLLLQQGGPKASAVSQTPLDISRPDAESVVAAIKRLAKTYPMLNREALLHDASTLMSAHVMQGRAANDVIDDLQALFESAYTAYNAKNSVEDA